MSAKVLIILPAFNEAETIENVIRALRREVPEYAILVVNDGSTDHTAEVVCACAKSCGNLDLVQLPFNLGIGGAMQTGYKYALRNGYDIAVQCDADGQHPVDRIRDLVSHVEAKQADLVIGSRYVADSDYVPSLTRRLGKSLLSRFVDALIGGGITDTTSGFRAANRNTIEAFSLVYPDDYPEPETLVILHKWGLKAAEVPVNMKPRQGGRTSINPRRAAYYMVKVGLAILMDIFRKFPNSSGGAV